ncbi:MAG: sulfotransferase family protein [Okeania sp. SIO2D1]|uniref:sulfotransferase-like domain-containing protein n=1 Tax=Okeania sp. SIO2C9 TaxID=2607791 RepID=UPI0013B7181B|nr:sulfotransferase family protein [Okeania sp. SIO2C9]NEQ76220.1 sulfotransferase family protein [Okeania sp. SIO2C9]NES70162.1 sulfotransferase family protein [Okeania sp. SIO2D1]
MKKILALWAVPRSTSTAFERMMRERGDFFVDDEPFGKSFYYSEERCNTTRYPDIEPDPQYNFSCILERLKQENEKQPVFIKDMSYQVAPVANQEFLSNFNNSFLIRHPEKMLPSLFNNWSDFTLEETGYAQLYKLFEMAQEISGKLPVVIDSDDLVKKPKATVEAYCYVIGIPFIEKALEWKAEPQPKINQWEGGWHNYVLSSQGFKEREKKDYVRIEDNEHLKKAYEFCLPYYQKLYEYRLRIE